MGRKKSRSCELTDREYKIVALVITAYSSQQIADKLNLPVDEVEDRIFKIGQKLSGRDDDDQLRRLWPGATTRVIGGTLEPHP